MNLHKFTTMNFYLGGNEILTVLKTIASSQRAELFSMLWNGLHLKSK